MRHCIFEEADTYKVAILVKATAFRKPELVTHYVQPLQALGLGLHELIAFTLEYNDKKVTNAFAKEYLGQLLPILDSVTIKYLYVADATYFKVLTGQTKAEPHYGYVLPCKLKGYEHLQVVLGVNHQQLIFDPAMQAKLTQGLQALASHAVGNYVAPGTGIIHSAQYPETLESIAAALKALHRYPSLSCDIEAFSLDFDKAGIGTISFAWDKHNGIAFACDYRPIIPLHGVPVSVYGQQVENPAVRALLKEFFDTYQGELTFHRAAYDVKVLTYVLYMKDLLDRKGMLDGLDVLCRNMHDTKIIAYLATNSTAGNVLGLKPLAHEFSGNWAKDDINDIRKIPLPELLQYNLVDALSTHYVREKYEPVMVADQQEELYRTLMLPTQKVLLQAELVGMPMSKAKIAEIKAKLEAMRDENLNVLRTSPVIKTLELLVRHAKWQKDFDDRKAKAKNPGKIMPKELSAFDAEIFNPNSGPQKQRLLYELMGLPILDLTDSKQPATGAETLEKLVNHTPEQGYKDVINALIGYAQVAKILDSFIPAFERGIEKADDGVIWLHGCFNIGGTVSGRLSSSDPNLQNIPANSIFGKLIKEAFISPKGWIFAGADFNSLEDYVSALTTKDPNKLKVYIDGFDGHCLRAAFYFEKELLSEGLQVDITDPKSVNALKKTAAHWRQESKTPTFALTYQGTYHTLMANLGWPEDKAKAVENAYHELYKVSDQYVQDRLQQASKDGYVTVAFGLRVRTPVLAQVVFGGSKVPHEAAAEGRTAGNALGQSYGQLTNRSMVAFMEKVWKSKYRYDILPVSIIHDANYLLIRDELEIVEWANRELIGEMQWQQLPELQHDTVKLGAALDLYWPNWANPITLPNDADQETIKALCKEAQQAYLKKAA